MDEAPSLFAIRYFAIRTTKKGSGAPKGASNHGRPLFLFPLPLWRRVGRGGSGSSQTSLRSLRNLICRSRSPSGASQRRLPERANVPAQPRPCFTRSRGRRRYPHRQSRLSGAPRAPVVMPAGAIPGPPGSGVTSSARRNRTRSIQRLSPVDVPELSETGRVIVIAAAKSKGLNFPR